MAIALLVATGLFAQNLEGIYLSLPLSINGVIVDEVECLLPPEGDVLYSIDAKKLIAILSPLLKEDIIASLMEYDEIELVNLVSTGLPTVYDPENLQLSMTIPAGMKRQKTLSLITNRYTPTGEPLAPEPFAGYLNFFGNQDYSFSGDQHIASGGLTLESSLHVYNWIALSEIRFDSKEQIGLPEIGIIHDFPSLSLRSTFGHYSLRSHGFQKSGQYQGFSIESQPYMDPYRRSESGMNTNFLIEEPSQVQVWVNGRNIQTMQLEPGRYDLKDFPFYSGISKINLEITSPGEPVKTLVFYMHRDTDALARGEHEFFYSAGFLPWTRIQGYTISAYHEYGVLDELTLGLNFQLLLNESLYGASVIWASPIGTFSIDGGLSLDVFQYTGWAANAGYRFRFNSNRWIPVLGASLSYYADDFGIGTLASGIRVESNLYLTQRIFGNASLSASVNYAVFREAVPDELNMLTGITIPFFKESRVSVQFGSDLLEPTFDNMELSIRLQLSNSGKGRYFNYYQDAFSTSGTADFQQSLPKQDLTVSTGIQRAAEETEPTHSLYGGINYNGSRFNASGNLRYNFVPSGNSFGQSARFSTAVALAGGQLGLSKPIRDSFAIIIPRYNLEGRELGINKAVNYETQSGLLGPAVVSDIQSYRFKMLNVELLHPEDDDIFLLPQSHYVLLPSYRSGFLLEVGSESRFVFDFAVSDESGNPIPLIAGTIKREGEEEQWFFTDGNGRAIIYEIWEGEYVISVDGYETLVVDAERIGDDEIQKREIVLSSRGGKQ